MWAIMMYYHLILFHFKVCGKTGVVKMIHNGDATISFAGGKLWHINGQVEYIYSANIE